MSRNYRGRCSIVPFPASPSCHSLFPCSPFLRMTFRKTRCGTKSTAKNHWGIVKWTRLWAPTHPREKERETKRAFPPVAIINIFYRSERKHLRFLDAALLSIRRSMLPGIMENITWNFMVNFKRHEQDGCFFILIVKKPLFILNIILLKISNRVLSLYARFNTARIRMRIILNYRHISDLF